MRLQEFGVDPGKTTLRTKSTRRGIQESTEAQWLCGPSRVEHTADVALDEIDDPAREVTHVGPNRLTPEGARIRNPAFDVTPAKYVSAIITERGVARAPFDESLAALVSGQSAVGSRQ